MTQVKHTPAPWYTSIDKSITGEFKPYFDVYSKINGRTLIANCSNFMWRGDDMLDEAEANAKLIAAAPELLEALETIMLQQTIYPHLQVIAKAAITKATTI